MWSGRCSRKCIFGKLKSEFSLKASFSASFAWSEICVAVIARCLEGPSRFSISVRTRLPMSAACAFAFVCAQNSWNITLALWNSSKYVCIYPIVWLVWNLKWQRREKSTKLRTYLSAILKSQAWPASVFFRATARHKSKILPALRFSNPVHFFTAENTSLGFLKFGYSVQANHGWWKRSNPSFFFKNPIIQPIRCEKTPIQMHWSTSGANISWELTLWWGGKLLNHLSLPHRAVDDRC